MSEILSFLGTPMGEIFVLFAFLNIGLLTLCSRSLERIVKEITDIRETLDYQITKREREIP